MASWSSSMRCAYTYTMAVTPACPHDKLFTQDAAPGGLPPEHLHHVRRLRDDCGLQCGHRWLSRKAIAAVLAA
jgi:hypothetical protein